VGLAVCFPRVRSSGMSVDILDLLGHFPLLLQADKYWCKEVMLVVANSLPYVWVGGRHAMIGRPTGALSPTLAHQRGVRRQLLSDTRIRLFELRKNKAKVVHQILDSSSRAGKANRIYTPTLGIGSHYFLEWLATNFPYQAGSTTIWGDHECIPASAASRVFELRD